jgi:signal transduction histidine kinase
VLLTLSRLRNSAGAIIGTIGISKDITAEKRLQEKLIQSQRLAAIGEVFTGIQHSMKNMLNACKGGAYMVKTGLATDNHTMLVEGWDMVQEGIGRLTNMSTDMLKYVKEWVPTSVRVDLTPTLQEIHHIVQPTAAGKGVDFRLDIAPRLPAIVCDARMIHSAVMDIVSNALDACLWKEYRDGETPTITLRARADVGPGLHIEISDNGIGMTAEVKANIFTPFFSTKSKAGTGLGLSLSARMIGAHGGTIDVESEPNRGATFRIALPVDGTGKDKEHADGTEGSGS